MILETLPHPRDIAYVLPVKQYNEFSLIKLNSHVLTHQCTDYSIQINIKAGVKLYESTYHSKTNCVQLFVFNDVPPVFLLPFLPGLESFPPHL